MLIVDKILSDHICSFSSQNFELPHCTFKTKLEDFVLIHTMNSSNDKLFHTPRDQQSQVVAPYTLLLKDHHEGMYS